MQAVGGGGSYSDVTGRRGGGDQLDFWARTWRGPQALGLFLGLCAGAFGVGAQAAIPDSAQKQAADAGPHFDIMEYVVDGNTVLSVPDIEEAVYPFLGEGRSANDVDGARQALQQAYQAKGYQQVQVLIPQQGIESGIVHLQVSENPVGRLRVVDSKYHLPSAIKDMAPAVAEGKVLNAKDVQDNMVALNQEPGLKVTPQLKAGKAPGTVDVDLQVEDALPLHGNVEINNQYNQATQPLRVVGSLSYDNLWGEGHSISASYQVAPQKPSDAKIFSGTYLAPFPEDDFSILAYGVTSNSDVAAVAGTDVIGRGNIFGLRGIITLPGTDRFFQTATIGIDRKDLTQNVVTLNIPSDAPVLYYPITLAYHASLIDGDPKAGGTETDFDASANFALPGVGSDSTKLDPQRFNALKQYFYFKTGISRLQPLPWGMTFFGRIDGQITGDSLLSSEQFSAGGESSVRGYLEAERIGDYGARTTLELRSPSFGQWVSPRINDWHMLTFFDGAGLWLRNPLAGEHSSYTLAGIGIGTRLVAFDDFNAALDLAFPLLDGAVSTAGRPRIHFRVSEGF
jgi:hemolysin activation/secretion protein